MGSKEAPEAGEEVQELEPVDVCPGRQLREGCCCAQVVDMPLLFETGFYKLTRPGILVSCNMETQVWLLCPASAALKTL